MMYIFTIIRLQSNKKVSTYLRKSCKILFVSCSKYHFFNKTCFSNSNQPNETSEIYKSYTSEGYDKIIH